MATRTDKRTSVLVPKALKLQCEKAAKAVYPPIGWTQQLVLFAQRGVAIETVPRTMKPSE